MQEALLLVVTLGTFVFGYFVVKKIYDFLSQQYNKQRYCGRISLTGQEVSPNESDRNRKRQLPYQ